MDNSTIDLHGYLNEPAFLNILKEYLVFEDLPAKCLPSSSTSIRHKYPKIEDDGKRILKQMFDKCPLLSRTRVELYGSPEDLAENLKIYSDFPSNHRVFGFKPNWPYNTTITKYKSTKNEEEFIYKQDLFTYIHHLGLEYFGSQAPILVFQTICLKQFESYYDDCCEFIKYDQKWMDDLEKKFKKIWKKAQETVKDPSFAPEKIYDVLTPVFTDMTPNWMKNKEEMHLLPPAAVVRVLDGDFVFEKEFFDAIKLTENRCIPLYSKPLYPLIIPLDFFSGYNVLAHTKKVTFVEVPIKRAKHAVSPILSPFGGHCIPSVDAFFEIFRVLVFRHRIFQKFKKHQWLKVKTILKVLGTSFNPHMPPFFISVNVVADLKADLAEKMLLYTDLSFPEYRRVDHEGFSLEDLKDELSHSKLDEFFPEIARYARTVYEEVDKKKAKAVLRTCDFYEALERCQLISFLEKMPDLKLFLHQQKGCPRVPQMKCDYCKPFATTPKRFKKSRQSEYTMHEMSIMLQKNKEENLNYCSLVLEESEKEFSSNLRYFRPDQIHIFGVKFFILDSNDDVKRERNMKKLWSLSNYVAKHPFKKLYLRAIPTNTFIESRRVFTEEVLEIIQILLKLRNNDARLCHYRKKWPPGNNVTIDLVELRLVLEDFDVDKGRITIIPDASHEITVYRMHTEPQPLYFQVLSPNGKQMVMRPHQLIYFLFRRVVCSLNWNKERCKLHENCLEGFRKTVLDKMMEIAEFDENAYISTALLDNILQSFQKLCPSLYNTPPKVTAMSALSVHKYDETIENERFRTISRLFGLEESIKEHEEWNQEKIRIDMARYQYLMALMNRFLKGEADEIESILENELWYCNCPRVDEIKKPRGVEREKKSSESSSNDRMQSSTNVGCEIQKNPDKTRTKTQQGEQSNGVATKDSDEKKVALDAETYLHSEDVVRKISSTNPIQELVTENILENDQETKNDDSEVGGDVDLENVDITEKLAEISLQIIQGKESEHLECVARESEVMVAQKSEEDRGDDMEAERLSGLKVEENNGEKIAGDASYEPENVKNATEDIEAVIPDNIIEKSSPENQPDIGMEITTAVSQSDVEVAQKCESKGAIGEDGGGDEYEDSKAEDGKLKENVNEMLLRAANDQTTEKSDAEHMEQAEPNPETETEKNEQEVLEASSHLEPQVQDVTLPDVEMTESEVERKPEAIHVKKNLEMEINHTVNGEVAQKPEGEVEVGKEMINDKPQEKKIANTAEIVNDQATGESDTEPQEHIESYLETENKEKQHKVLEVSSHLEPQVQVGSATGEKMEELDEESQPESRKKEQPLEMEIKENQILGDVGSDGCELDDSELKNEEKLLSETSEGNLDAMNKETENGEIENVEIASSSVGSPDPELRLETKTGTYSESDTQLETPKCSIDVRSDSETEIQRKLGEDNVTGDSCDDQEATEDVESNPEMKEEETSKDQHVEPEEILNGDVESMEDTNPVEDPEGITRTEIFSPLEKEDDVKDEIKEEHELSDMGGDCSKDSDVSEPIETNMMHLEEGIPMNQHVESKEIQESSGEHVEDKNPEKDSEDISEKVITSSLEKEEDVKIVIKEEHELSEMSGDNFDDSNVSEPIKTKMMRPEEELPMNEHVKQDEIRENYKESSKDKNPVDDSEDVQETDILSPLRKEEDMKIEIMEEQELSDVSRDSCEDPETTQNVEANPEKKGDEILKNQHVESEEIQKNSGENVEDKNPVAYKNPETQAVEDSEQQKKTLAPLHVEIGNPRASHAEMKDSGWSEASTIMESITEASQKPVSWKHEETQTSLTESRAKDKEIKGLKRANLQLAQQSKNQINQLQEKFEATKSQLNQRITELEEELKMERDKVATPCHNNEVEELRKTIKLLQENNVALSIRDEEKAKMIKMLVESMRGSSVTERSVGEEVEKAASSATKSTVSE